MSIRSRTPSRHDFGAHHLFAAVVAAFTLNAVLVLGDFIESSWALLPAQISLELVALLVLTTVLPRRGVGFGSFSQWLLATLLLGLILLRIADIVVPWSFGRNFNAAVDMKYLPFFIDLLRGSLNPALFIALATAALILLLAALALLRWSIGVMASVGAAVRLRAFLVVALLAAPAYAATPPRYDLGAFPFSSAVAAAAWRNASYVWDAKGFSDRYLAQINAATAVLPLSPDMSALKGRNVLLMFAESYGAITFTDPTLAEILNPVRSRFEESARKAGYHMYSSMLNSPITGGGSWMAHATMTAGVRIDAQARVGSRS